MRKRIGTWLAATLTLAVLTGCQGENGAGGQEVKILYSLAEGGDYYEKLAGMAGNKALEEGVQLDVAYADNSIEAQDAHIKKAVEEGYDVIMCGLVSPDTATVVKAIAGDIPIVFVNSAPDDKVLECDEDIYVASDETIAGQYQAEYVLEQLKDRDEINVVILKGPKGHSATEGRTGGAKKVLEASGKKINYVFEDYADFNADKAQKLMEIFLKTDTRIDCVICNNDDMALGAVAAFENANIDTDSVLVLGIDASVNGCEAIKNGTMVFSAFQNNQEQSERAVEAAIRMANGQSIQQLEGATEDGKYVWIPFEKVDSGNVEQYSQ